MHIAQRQDVDAQMLVNFQLALDPVGISRCGEAHAGYDDEVYAVVNPDRHTRLSILTDGYIHSLFSLCSR